MISYQQDKCCVSDTFNQLLTVPLCCMFVGAAEESIKHVWMECTVAKEFWHQVKMMTGVKIPILHLVTWATDLLADICSRRDRAIIIYGMWARWMMRNKRRHGE